MTLSCIMSWKKMIFTMPTSSTPTRVFSEICAHNEVDSRGIHRRLLLLDNLRLLSHLAAVPIITLLPLGLLYFGFPTELEIITNNFKRQLGKGGFGSVFHGNLENNVQVAVKMLSQSSSQDMKEFHVENYHYISS